VARAPRTAATPPPRQRQLVKLRDAPDYPPNWSRSTLERRIRAGVLPAYKQGGTLFIDLNELDDLIVAGRIPIPANVEVARSA
jgi:hypothetical protein